ncbi:hypothetical protein CNMCM5793_000666 [Aspergillus hiratsukae]|uniref:Ornithine decarboxylase n=1 Tax=Aspergillus hiratsukae TaxID=1194566 RepID=A0A8H6PA13_9EURO|nr:hypothetical protein CNMCM5793_000666 [Aspergillus hiratsukae]KAF7163014.1 hypothetical protein CNMCM6106_000099 [Aspergillus hiratsukae]
MQADGVRFDASEYLKMLSRAGNAKSEVTQLTKIINNLEVKLGSKPSQVMISDNVQPPDAQESDVESSGSDFPMTDRPSHLRSLFQNDWLSVDTSRNDDKGEERQGKVSSQFSRLVRPRLQSLIPPKDEVQEIAGSSFDWLTMLHTLLPQPCSVVSQKELLVRYEEMRSPDVNIVTLASWLLALAITAQQLPQDTENREDQLKKGQKRTDLCRKIANTLEGTLLCHDRLLATAEGLGMAIHFSRLHIGQGNFQKSWLTIRRLIAIAELMGLPRIYQAVRLDKISETDDQHSYRMAQLWELLCNIERLSGMILNLPPDSRRYRPSPNRPLVVDGVIQSHVYITKLLDIGVRIHEIDESSASQRPAPEIHMTALEMARDLGTLAAQTPSTWWLVNEASPVNTDQIVQFFHYTTLMRVYIPMALRQDAREEYLYSRLPCMDACDAVARRYIFLRRKLPPGIFVARVIDLQAFTATAVLLLMSRNASPTDRRSFQVDTSQIQGVIAEVIKLMGQRSKDPMGFEFAEQAFNTLCSLNQLLRQDENTASEQTLTLQVPLLGRLHIRRNVKSSQTTATNAKEPSPLAPSEARSQEAISAALLQGPVGYQAPTVMDGAGAVPNGLQWNDFSWSIEDTHESLFNDAFMGDALDQAALCNRQSQDGTKQKKNFTTDHASPIIDLAFHPSTIMTGVSVRIRTTTATAACVPNTTAVPSLAIQEGWKYPTEKPLAVRQALMMAETTVDCDMQLAKADSHCTGDHAKHNHQPAKGETNPMFMVVQGHAVCQQSASHDSNGDPDTMKSVLGTPLLLTRVFDPAVKPVATVLNDAQPSTPLTMVDIGGGRGEMLFDFKAAFTQLQSSDLTVQEFNHDITDIPGVTLASWNYKDESPQPIQGALIYHLAHILHNLSDLEAVRLLKKISEAMAPYSRLLIHGFAKNATYAKMHAAMIALYGGRERSSAEWHQMAELAGLRTRLLSMSSREWDTADEPFFVADLGQVMRQHRRWRLNLPNVHPFYAVKCNPDPRLLQLLAELGTGFDCASIQELRVVLNLGVDPSRVIFANPCKSASSLLFAARTGVTLTTFDNVDELETIRAFLPNAQLVLRIYASDNDALIKLGEKFGAPVEASFVLLQRARELSLEVRGVSFHVGTGASSASAYVNAIRHAKMVFELGKSLGYDMNLLDIGGGFQDSNFEEIAQSVREALMDGFQSKTRIIAEPGRYYARSTYTLACKVLSRRCHIGEAAQTRPDMLYQNDGVYGSFMNVLLEKEVVHPSLIPRSPPYHLADTKRAPGLRCYSIWGPTCDSVDCVVRETTLDSEVRVGDWLKYSNMGGEPPFRYLLLKQSLTGSSLYYGDFNAI